MRPTVILGRFRGIAIGLHWSVLIVLVLVTVTLAASRLPDDVGHYSDAAYWIAAVITSLAFLASILVHEMSHAVVALRNGIAVNSITLWALGGIAQLRGDARSARDEFQVAVVGPLTSVAIGIVAGAVALALDAAGASAL